MKPGSPVIKGRRVQVAEAACTVTGEKHLELLEQDGVVHAIRLRCSCGEDTVIELEYPSSPNASPEAGAESA